MKCYLHIGTAKTATTALQSFLHLNRNKLSKSGFGYTKSAGKTNNWELPVAAYDLDRRDDLTNVSNIFTNEDLFEHQRGIISELKEEIIAISQPNIIFSSEHIQSRLTNISEIQRLKKILVNLGAYDISVIIYLRNPSEIASSLYSTAIINGHTISIPPSPKNAYFNNVCNHKNTLEKFELVFGKQALIPRIFDKNEFKNGSIIEDFINIIGAPWCDDYDIPNNINESLSALGLEILRRFNKKVPLFIDNKSNPLRSDIVEYFQHNFSDNKYLIPRYLYKEYEIEFQESNEWVRRNFFPQRDFLFSKKVHSTETKLQIPDDKLDQFANMLADIWIEKSKRINALTKQ